MNSIQRRSRSSPVLLCLSVVVSFFAWCWTCCVVIYLLSDPQRWAMVRYATSLFHGTRLAVPLIIPPSLSTSSLLLRVDLDQVPLFQQDEALQQDAQSAIVLKADSPVRLMGALSIQVVALDAAGCVTASASARYRASGEPQIQVPLTLRAVATLGCISPEHEGHTTQAEIASSQAADRN